MSYDYFYTAFDDIGVEINKEDVSSMTQNFNVGDIFLVDEPRYQFLIKE